MSNRGLLIVDDEPDFRTFVREVAEGLGYAVTDTGSPDTFKEYYLSLRPGTVIVDVIMPEVDGLELLQWLGEQDAGARIIVVTGYDPRYADFAAILGTDKGLTIETLKKPIRVAQLREALSVPDAAQSAETGA